MPENKYFIFIDVSDKAKKTLLSIYIWIDIKREKSKLASFQRKRGGDTVAFGINAK